MPKAITNARIGDGDHSNPETETRCAASVGGTV